MKAKPMIEAIKTLPAMIRIAFLFVFVMVLVLKYVGKGKNLFGIINEKQ